jgi:hypothetical protein
MGIKVILILVIIAVLLEDGSSIKKTEEEKKEEEEIAKAVNRTLAVEKRKEDEEKKKLGQEKSKKEVKNGEEDKSERDQKQDRQDEACLPVNVTCSKQGECDPCPEVGQCPPCGPCPKERECSPCEECPEEKPCRPCGPCPVGNSTRGGQELPTPPSCPEPSTMTVPVAMAVGACASLLLTGVATAIGLLLRYVQPTISGLLLIAIFILVWYLSSQYPDTARELGGRAVNLLREAAVAVSHRVMEAIRRHQEQVSVPITSILPTF